jgi:hypothetical protein
VLSLPDTEPEQGATPLPPKIDRPIEIRRGKVGGELWQTIENAKRNGVRITERDAGSQDAGEMRDAEGEKYIAFQANRDRNPST